MNSVELEVEMKRHNDTGATLAAAIGITPPTLCNKKNGKALFTQAEIMKIKNRYVLSDARVGEIFF